MIRVALIALILAGCSAPEPPRFGSKVEPPQGWTDCRLIGRQECQQ